MRWRCRFCPLRRTHSPAEARWRKIIVLYTFFRDERAAFSRASQTLKFFAARRSCVVTESAAGAAEEAEIFERHAEAHRSPLTPAEEQDAKRAPLGWWGSRIGRLARFSGDKPDSGSTSSGIEEDPDSRSNLA